MEKTMKFEDKLFSSQSLAKRVEFITLQSSEQREEEVRYKNINRKQIRFDLSDIAVMLALGEILRPYGVKEFIENKLAQSNVMIFRLWGEKKLAKRGEKFIRALFLKHPEKFSQVEFKTIRNPRMKMVRGTFIISELVNQKTISLKNEKEGYLAELESFKEKFKAEEAKLLMHKNVIEELNSENNDERLIGMDA